MPAASLDSVEDQPTLTREPGTGRQLVRSTGTSGDTEEVTWWRCLCGKKRSWSKAFEMMRLMTEGLGGVCVVTIAFWVLYEFINPNSQKEEKTNSWVSQHSINYISNSSSKLTEAKKAFADPCYWRDWQKCLRACLTEARNPGCLPCSESTVTFYLEWQLLLEERRLPWSSFTSSWGPVSGKKHLLSGHSS